MVYISWCSYYGILSKSTIVLTNSWAARGFATIREKQLLSTNRFLTPGPNETKTEERPIPFQGATVNGTPDKKTIGVWKKSSKIFSPESETPNMHSEILREINTFFKKKKTKNPYFPQPVVVVPPVEGR